MRLGTIVGVSFYTIIFLLVGGLILAYALHWFVLEDLIMLLQYSYNTANVRFVIGSIGLFIILVSIGFSQIILGNLQKEKTIAFSTSLGQGSISLSAVEDLIKRIATQFYEIRDIRSDVVATKKGLEVSLRVVLRFETNILEFTIRLQESIKAKLQEVLGIDENITIQTHIAKIVSISEKKKKDEDDIQAETKIPFRGYAQA